MKKTKQKLTVKQKKDYLVDPSTCPNCNSINVSKRDDWEDILCMYEEWSCGECKKWWIDTYTLTDVELSGE